MGEGEYVFKYEYESGETQLNQDPNVALFFLERDLHSGNKMNLHFSKPTIHQPFLPRQLANSTPFSSKNPPRMRGRRLEGRGEALRDISGVHDWLRHLRAGEGSGGGVDGVQ